MASLDIAPQGLQPKKVSLRRLRRRLQEVLRTTPYPYQLRGVRFIEKYDGNVVVADDMGLGKSLQAIAWCLLHPDRRPVIVACPAPLKYNWKNEWKLHAGIRAHICNGTITTEDQDKKALEERIERATTKLRKRAWRSGWGLRRAIRKAVRGIRKSLRRKKKDQHQRIAEAKKAKIIVVNYDVLEGWAPALIKLNPKTLIIDEAHYVKSRSAKRTKACRALSKIVDHVIGLSGTPISGGPAEFFSILQMVRPAEFQSFWTFGFKYCQPKKNKWSGGWDFSGASNLDELHHRLKTIMIRRLKRKVLKDLPTKTRSVIPIDIDNRDEYEEAEQNFLSWLLEHKGELALKRAMRAEAIVRLNGLKILAAQGKMNLAIRWIKDWLEGTDQKLVVFGIHKVIMNRLKEEFPRATVIDGTVSGKARQDRVDKFQNTPASKDMKKRLKGDGLLLGQLKAAGVGLNLHSAANVLFLELGWTPGEHDQAEDRVLRIGQKNKVSIYYLVGKNTVEVKILNIIQAKDETVSRILDGKKSGGVMKLLNIFLKRLKRVA